MFKRHNLFCTLLLIIHLLVFQATGKQGDYFRGPEKLSYCDSVNYCQIYGGELAVIRNKDQNTAAADICIGQNHHDDDYCWLGLTEYVGNKNTEIDYQLWIWRDGSASTLPKKRTYSLGHGNIPASNNTGTLQSKENNQKRVPLSSYEYENWRTSQPNNKGGCDESHAIMGTRYLGKWYDTNAYQYVKYIPLCENINTTHENPIHDHQCDTTFSNCWYEQCRNTGVGQDDSKCWSKKDSTSPPKCSESATLKYTELEMKYDGEVYVEYTCCDDNDDSGRDKYSQISQQCYADYADYKKNKEREGELFFFLLFMLFALLLGILDWLRKKKEKEKKEKKEKQEKHSSKIIPVGTLTSDSLRASLVHAMLARRLKKDKTFHKYMDKVDKDESGSLSRKEWRKLLAKLKKKDHASDSWELTSDIVELTFKLVLASTKSNDGELTYAGLQAWVVLETESKVDSALSADISSWGRNAPDEINMTRETVKILPVQGILLAPKIQKVSISANEYI